MKTVAAERAHLMLHHARTLREYHGRDMAIEIAQERLSEARDVADAKYWGAVINNLKGRM